MEKIKNLLSGHKNEEPVQSSIGTTGTTGTTAGHSTGLAGEGSHFGTAKEPIGSAQIPEDHLGVGNTQNTTVGGQGSHFDNTRSNAGVGQTSGLTGEGPLTSAHNTSEGAGKTFGLAAPNTASGHREIGPDAAANHQTPGMSGTIHNTGLGNTQNTSSGHVLGGGSGGTAALATAGAAGEGVHHRQNEDFGSNTGGLTDRSVSGPHSTATANKLDPSVNTHGPSGLEPAAHHHSDNAQRHGGGGEEADKHHSAGLTSGRTDSTTSSSHHLGRDAAIGAGGVGLAEHEHNKHNQGVTGSSGTATGATTGLSGPVHDSSVLNKLDPRVKTSERDAQTSGNSGTSTSTTGTQPHDSQLGRDAALAGGVGTAGYEAEKHHRHNDSGVGGVTSPIQADRAGHSVTQPRRTEHDDPRGTTTHSNVGTDQHRDHHYGRDAAVAGGVGGAAYEADKHHKHDKDLSAAEKEQKKQHKHEVKEEKKEHKSGGLFGFLHRDKSKKYSKEEEAEFERQEREHNSHKGRDAALGGAAIGGGAYEAEKHHGHHENAATNKALPTAPGNHGIGTGAGTQNALAGENGSQVHSGQLVGEHAHQGTGVPLNEKPLGSDIGDKLHGTERNRGVQGTTGFPHESTGHNQHHTGRDAALGAGAVGVGEHEHRKHEANTGLTGSNYDSNSSSLAGGQHHPGRDVALGAGAVGVGEHEHRKHEGLTGQDATTGHGLHHAGANIGDERNRLQKDAPLGHPSNPGNTGI